MKKCPECGDKSYSSRKKGGEWICPYCNQDISDEKIETIKPD